MALSCVCEYVCVALFIEDVVGIVNLENFENNFCAESFAINVQTSYSQSIRD
jgi:hypothetical protein